MSASSKKKLRKEQTAALLTEKQQQAQKEAKKLKITSIAFVAALLVLVVAFAAIMSVNLVKNSGMIEKKTIAATVGDHKINSVEFNYYYTDLITNTYNEWYSAYGDSMSTYMSMMGLDLSKPLNEQTYATNEDGSTMTWADYFTDYALERMQSDYALYDAAMAAGYELTEEDQTSLDTAMTMMDLYAQWYGYSNTTKYLQAMYGPGAKESTYAEYSRMSTVATSYYNSHANALTYDIPTIEAYDAEHATNYNSYSYAYYYINYSKFLGEGTKDESGAVVYTEEERNAAREEAKAVAESLLTAKTVEEFDAAIAALEINKESTSATSNKLDKEQGSATGSIFKEWVQDASRKEGDMAALPYTSTSTDADGKETTVTNGYYVVLFQGVITNERPVGNVRHLLVKFEGGTTENGTTTYSVAEKEAAKTEAEGYLNTWLNGTKTEESFIELVKAHSDDSSASTGGLFEDITPASSYVTSFRDWAIDENRKVGDAEVIESEYGYHVMYYVGASELNYRQMLVEADIRAEDQDKWYDEIFNSITATLGDLKCIELDKVLG